MTTLGLLWGTLWRGGAWGLFTGSMLGASYGALFAVGSFVFGLLANSATLLTPADAPRSIVAALFLALIGSVTGALFGVPTGFVVGISNGFVFGILTRAFFFPLKDAPAHRRAVVIVSALFTTVASWVGFVFILQLYAKNNTIALSTALIIATLPALIAGVAAGLISRHMARWYEKHFFPI